jgi:hypothetical protein
VLHTCTVLALLLLLPPAARAERRTALVMGNAAYEVGLLRNPVHDARDMAMALRQLASKSPYCVMRRAVP